MATAALLMPDPTTDKPLRPRRRIPLSLRMFAMFLIVLAGSTFWIGLSNWLLWHREQPVVRMLGRYDYPYLTEKRIPTWIRRLAGDDRVSKFNIFDRVIFVDLSYTAVSEPEIAQLKDLPCLKALGLQDTAATDASLAHLSRLTNLTHVSVSRTAITDSGLTYLKGCTGLKLLGISGTKVTDKGIEELQKALPACEIRY